MPEAEIQFKYQGALASVVGDADGLAPSEWKDLQRETTAIVRVINKKRNETPWRDLPTKRQLSQLDAVLASARSKRGKFDDLVILGIGGSALGLTALKTALRPPYWNLLSPRLRGGCPRLWVMDNVDPDEFAAMTELIDPHRTLFNVSSKSGETAETMSQFLVALELVQECVGKNWRKHFVLTTDAHKGILRPMVDAEGMESFVVPDGVGGRFSILSPVGLFGAAMIGIDVKGLLAGAAAADKFCSSTAFAANLAAQGAAVQIGLCRKGKVMTVMMPYSAALKDVADWFRQLWAESLGKIQPDGTFVGQTPIKALGVTDQHSQVQLYREVPNDKVFTILSVEKFGCQLPLPDAPKILKGLDYLKGHSMKELLKAEEQATAWALAAVSKRPTVRFTLPAVTPRAVGALLYTLMVQTSVAGEMLGINTYNQPGVETGKEATRALMGKTGPIEGLAKSGLPAEFKTYEILRNRIEDNPV
ncbi:MAG: glucose-6-phosphate isomerase [Planctomycetota bacterium]|nr:glucose-6-phosphate isomerase [Planctomycetota bacterium]